MELYAGKKEKDSINMDFNINFEEKVKKEKKFLKKKRKGKKFEFYFDEKISKNEFDEGDDGASVSGSCSDTDKSIISSNSELDNELEFGKDYSNERNEII